MKQRTKAFVCTGVSILFFSIGILYFVFTPFGLLKPKDFETDKFARRASISIMSISLACSPVVFLAIWFRKLQFLMAWLILQGILWQFNIILTVIILFAIVRGGNPNKTPHDAAMFILYVILDTIWFFIGYGIWRYWKLLNDIKHFPIYERYNLEIQGGRAVQPESIDFDSVSMRDFDRLAAFGWRRGH